MEFTLPLCLIPFEKDYKERVKRFFEAEGKEQIEEFRKEKENEYNLEIRFLNWDKELGLQNITLSASCGLDLDSNARRYIFHNIYDTDSKEAKILFEIAEHYIKRLKII